MKRHARRSGKESGQKAAMLRRCGEEQFRALAENTFDIVCELDTAGRCIASGQNCGRVLGMSAEEIKGKSLFECVNPADRDAVAAQFNAVMAGRPGESVEFRC